MRIIKNIGLLSLALSGLFMSCEKLDELTQIDLSTDIDETTHVSITDTNELTFEGSQTLYLQSSEELNRYLSDLKDLEVKQISYKVSNYTGSDEGTMSGILTFEEVGFDLILPETNLKESSDNEIVTNIDATDEQLNQIADYLIQSQKATITLSCTTSEGPMEFDLTLIASISATAEIEKE